MGEMASQFAILTIAYSAVYSGADQRKYQSSALLAICEGNSPVTGESPPPPKGQYRGKCSHMTTSSWSHNVYINVDHDEQIHDTNCVIRYYLLHVSVLEFEHIGPWISFELRIFKLILKINAMNISGEMSIKLLATDIPND